MRSTKDLVQDLSSATTTHGIQGAAIIVAFDKESKPVFHRGDADPELKETLSELNALVKAGGIPMGIMGQHLDGKITRLVYYIFPEHAHLPEAEQFFEDYMDLMAAELRARGIIPVGPQKRFLN